MCRGEREKRSRKEDTDNSPLTDLCWKVALHTPTEQEEEGKAINY